jgi:hypothetical protein
LLAGLADESRSILTAHRSLVEELAKRLTKEKEIPNHEVHEFLSPRFREQNLTIKNSREAALRMPFSFQRKPARYSLPSSASVRPKPVAVYTLLTAKRAFWFVGNTSQRTYVVRTFFYEPEGREFKSPRAHHFHCYLFSITSSFTLKLNCAHVVPFGKSPPCHALRTEQNRSTGPPPKARSFLHLSLCESLFCPILDLQVLPSAKRTIVGYQNGFGSQRVRPDHHVQISHGGPRNLKGGPHIGIVPRRVGIPR